ncbi:SAVED domain-containing protein [Bifidobacterium mongoliense]|uniref:SAVED domain-containing protein n=1 Tax=Bifidobacterium mongoliense TaxID=518643 RepID=UPI0030ECFF44
MTRFSACIRLTAEAYETIASESTKHLPKETGGILFGYLEDGMVVVTHAKVIDGGTATGNRYYRDAIRANTILTKFLQDRADDDPIGYIGEWHSHPAPFGPSQLDKDAMRAIVKDSNSPIALLVYAPYKTSKFFGFIVRRRRFGRSLIRKAKVSLPPPGFQNLGSLPDGAVRGDGPVFISYRQSDGSDQAKSLESLLRAAGIVVWRDHTDLRPGTTIDRLEQALTGGLSGGMLIVTSEIVHSDIVRERELPRLLQLAENPAFSFCIANTIARIGDKKQCDYDAPDRLLGLALSGTLAAKKQTNMLNLSGEIEIVRDLLMHRVEQRTPMLRKEGREFTIRVQSRAVPSALDAGEDDLYIHLAPSNSGRPPSQTGLKCLQKTLPLISDAVYATQAKCIRISGGAHLSIALALGAAFPETRFGNIKVIDVNENEWESPQNHQYSQYDNLHVEKIETGQYAKKEVPSRVAVFVTLTPAPDYTAFERLLKDKTANFVAAEVISINGIERIDPREGGNLSEGIAREIKLLASRQGRAEVHLAFHGPFAMALLIGRYLNTLRTVVYEWDGDAASGPRYIPTVILEPGMKDGPIVGIPVHEKVKCFERCQVVAKYERIREIWRNMRPV